METFDTTVSTVMRGVVGALQTPVVLLLLLAMLFAVVLLGTVIGEHFSEHRKFQVSLPAFIDDLRASYDKGCDSTRQVITRSGLLMRQKVCLVELTRHPDITPTMRESLAVGLEYREQRRYEGIVKVTDIMSRIAPMLGLLGTLIPLGPGITAISSGDTDLLSSALLTAFDTTSTGLIIAAVCLVVSAIRKRWYRDYMTCFQAALECVLEMENARCDGVLRKKNADAQSVGSTVYAVVDLNSEASKGAQNGAQEGMRNGAQDGAQEGMRNGAQGGAQEGAQDEECGPIDSRALYMGGEI